MCSFKGFASLPVLFCVGPQKARSWGHLGSSPTHAAVAVTATGCCCLCRFVCDELDGRAARTFNQTSTMGAVLDMVTDR
jgi:phosphatidylglycerophosphate synthase